jgi:hypothetical protein
VAPDILSEYSSCPTELAEPSGKPCKSTYTRAAAERRHKHTLPTYPLSDRGTAAMSAPTGNVLFRTHSLPFSWSTSVLRYILLHDSYFLSPPKPTLWQWRSPRLRPHNSTHSIETSATFCLLSTWMGGRVGTSVSLVSWCIPWPLKGMVLSLRNFSDSLSLLAPTGYEPPLFPDGFPKHIHRNSPTLILRHCRLRQLVSPKRLQHFPRAQNINTQELKEDESVSALNSI